jgi:alpha-amylase
MIKTRLILGSHSHTPYGTLAASAESLYQNRYKPFIAALYRYPEIPATLHYSGSLLAWLEQSHPEFLMILSEMAERKQVELLGGGFYEPMFPLLPLVDRIGQIELLTTLLRKKFGKRPRGCWLPGMIWEQSLVGALQTAGMDYVFLSVEQFRAAGLSGAAAERPCHTEDQGKLLTVFPVATALGKAMAEDGPRSAWRKRADGQDEAVGRCLVVFPDWFESRPADGAAAETALARWFEDLAGIEDVELTTPSRFLKTGRVGQTAYFSSSADEKVMYWAMGNQRRQAFERLRDAAVRMPAGADGLFSGAFPRQFLTRYPEANGLYAKMVYSHALINQLRGDKYRKKAAREELWKAQGCDGFWHVGGDGLYVGDLRKAAYSAMIDAEKITREKGAFQPALVSFDFDLDGEREYLFRGGELNVYVKAQGGAVFELDYLPKAWNYLDTLARRPESYLEAGKPVDAYRRSAFVDYLLPPGFVVGQLDSASDAGARCCAGDRYEELAVDSARQELALRKPAGLTGPFAAIEIVKKYQLKKNALTVSYALINHGDKIERFAFAPEIDLSLAGDGVDQQAIAWKRADGAGRSALADVVLRGVDEVVLEDLGRGIKLTLAGTGPGEVWVRAIRTTCRIGGEIVDQYQSTSLMPVRPVTLAPKESWETRFTLRAGK